MEGISFFFLEVKMKESRLVESIKELLTDELLNLVEAVQNGNTFYPTDVIDFILEYCDYYANGAYTIYTEECEDNVLAYIKEEGFEYFYEIISVFDKDIIKEPHKLEMIFMIEKSKELFENMSFENIDPYDSVDTPEKALALIDELNTKMNLGIKYEE